MNNKKQIVHNSAIIIFLAITILGCVKNKTSRFSYNTGLKKLKIDSKLELGKKELLKKAVKFLIAEESRDFEQLYILMDEKRYFFSVADDFFPPETNVDSVLVTKKFSESPKAYQKSIRQYYNLIDAIAEKSACELEYPDTLRGKYYLEQTDSSITLYVTFLNSYLKSKTDNWHTGDADCSGYTPPTKRLIFDKNSGLIISVPETIKMNEKNTK